MKVKDLFGVLLNTEDVSLYNAWGVLEWVGEFKEIPHRYFELIIDTMYSAPNINKGTHIVINLKTNYTRGQEGGEVRDARSIFRSS